MKSLVDIATFKKNLELERLLALIQIPPEKPPVVLRRLPRLKIRQLYCARQKHG
jgi:hypothetical protein